MSAKKLLDMLERNGLLEDAVMADLRKQVADGKGKVTAETIAKVLVDKGHLTKFQATKLVGEATAGEEPKVEAKPAKKGGDDELLDLAPLEDAADAPPAKPAAGKPSGGKPPAPLDEVVILDEADALTPVVDAGAGLTPIGGPPLTPVGLTPIGPGPAANPFGGDPFAGDLGGMTPLDDGLTPLGGPDPFAQPTAAGAAPAPGPGGLRVAKKRQTRWDTKLMLGGFCGLAVMIFLGAILFYWIYSEPAIVIWQAAEEAYNQGSFNDAKDKYEKFLAAAGDKDVNSSKARVRLHMTKLRNDIGDPERGLASAESLLPLIDQEPDGSIARDEYPGLLPQIPEGFIKRAQQAKDTAAAEELVGKARKARDMVHNPGVISSANRAKIQPQLTRIDEDIALLERGIQQSKDLAQAITEIGAAADSGDTIKGYQLYNDLLRKFPGVKADSGLNEAVAKVTARERQLVKIKQEELAAATDDLARQSEFRVVLATRTGNDSKLQNQFATLFYGNSAYTLDAGTGKVLWSRFLGTTGTAAPVRVGAAPDADVLLVDAQRQELLRLQVATGKLVWRLPIGEPCTEPAVAGSRIYVSTHSGKILEVDAETGNSRRHVQIQQKLSVPPVVSPDRPRMYQVGEHSNIYVIHSESMQCEDVIYLGHKAGSVHLPPLIMMGHVFVTESPAPDYSLLHAFRVRGQGEGPKLFRPQDAMRTGRIVVSPAAFGRRLLVVTALGEIQVFDVDSTKNEATLSSAGKVAATQRSPLLGFTLTDSSTIWVADDKLTKYTHQATKNEITRDPNAITNVGDAFVGPMQLFESHLIHVRRPTGSTGAMVACVHVDDPRKPVWQTQLGVPAGRIAVDAAKKEIVAISSGASLFLINGGALKSGYVDQPMQSVAPSANGLAFNQVVDLPNNQVAFVNSSENQQLLVYDPAVPESRLKLSPLAMSGTRASCPPIALGAGVLIPSDRGEVWLFKSDGSQLALPFLPKLEAGDRVQWIRPAVVGGGREVVIADSRRNIYRLGIKDQPQAHLSPLLASKLDHDIATGLAAAGETVYAVTRTADKGDLLLVLSSTDLKVTKEIDLQGARVTWGPERVQEGVAIVTDAKALRIFDAEMKERWAQPAPMHGNPAGPPLVAGENLVFASVDGNVWSLNAAGQEIGMTRVGEPLGAGPAAYQERLLLCGSDGTLHVVSMPKPAAAP